MKPLAIDPATPPHVKSLIKSLENHYFSDVHTMLRLPQPDYDLAAGCNFAITQVLAAAVSGISVTLYSHTGSSGKRFKGLLKDFYPWSSETGNAVTPQAGAEVIYSVIRNPLTHDLGFDLENKRQGQKIKTKRLTTENNRKGLPENVIAQLEAPGRALEMSPMVVVKSGETVILVEAFYWGVRRMVEELSRNRSRMQAANEFLSKLAAMP